MFFGRTILSRGLVLTGVYVRVRGWVRDRGGFRGRVKGYVRFRSGGSGLGLGVRLRL